MDKKPKKPRIYRKVTTSLPGYPHYPKKEDVFNRGDVQKEPDPENPKSKKPPVEKTGELNEKNFEEAMSGSDLDVPGAELDDAQEETGSEDEENNLYSNKAGDKD